MQLKVFSTNNIRMTHFTKLVNRAYNFAKSYCRRVGLQLPNTAASAAWAAQPQIPAAVTAPGAPIQQPAAAAAPTIIPAYPATMQQFQVR